LPDGTRRHLRRSDPSRQRARYEEIGFIEDDEQEPGVDTTRCLDMAVLGERAFGLRVCRDWLFKNTEPRRQLLVPSRAGRHAVIFQPGAGSAPKHLGAGVACEPQRSLTGQIGTGGCAQDLMAEYVDAFHFGDRQASRQGQGE